MDIAQIGDVLTSKEVALMLAVHPNTVYRMSKLGTLPSVKVGRSRRFFRRDVVALLERGQRLIA